jgi:hypothetical protein
MKSHTFLYYLREYARLYPEEDVMVMYRPTPDSYWNDRCLFGSEKYNAFKPYNHRSMLKNEVVIEFDHEDPVINAKETDKVCKRLKDDNITFARWQSGNKSHHVHVLLAIPEEIRDRKTLKKAFLDVYTEGLEVKPDYQLCIDNHLIRAENGLHEKTGRHKTLIRATEDYPKNSGVPEAVWRRYGLRVRESIARAAARTTQVIKDSRAVKFLLSTQDFGSVGDGRERALFILSQVLRSEYSQDDLVQFLQDWYRYSGGKKLSKQQVAQKVRYSYGKQYNITERYVEEFLQEIGHKI